jgi:hypothetical protein
VDEKRIPRFTTTLDDTQRHAIDRCAFLHVLGDASLFVLLLLLPPFLHATHRRSQFSHPRVHGGEKLLKGLQQQQQRQGTACSSG